LIEEEKQVLLKLYPTTWKDAQTGPGSVSGLLPQAPAPHDFLR
jgi:hypothetical protein